MFRDLERKLGAALNGFAANVGSGPGESYRLGKGDGTATITNPSGLYAREVWVYRDLATGRSADFAILPDWMPYEDNANFVGLPVKVGKEPGEKMLRVLRLDGLAGNQTQGNTSLMEGKIQQASHPAVSDISTFRVRATAPTATLNVAIDGPFFYYKPSTSARQVYTGGLPSTTSPTVAATVAALAGTGQHQLAVVCLDPETGSLILVTSSAATPVNALGTQSAHDEFTSTDAAGLAILTYIPGAPFELYDGQTSVVEANFYRGFDLRSVWPPIQAYLPLTGGSLSGALTVSGRLTTQSGRNVKVRVVTAAGAVTVTTADYLVCLNKTVGAATTVNLPASPSAGDSYIIKDKKADAATNNITLTPAAGNIDGAGTYVMNINRQSVTVIYDGSEWSVN